MFPVHWKWLRDSVLIHPISQQKHTSSPRTSDRIERCGFPARLPTRMWILTSTRCGRAPSSSHSSGSECAKILRGIFLCSPSIHSGTCWVGTEPHGGPASHSVPDPHFLPNSCSFCFFQAPILARKKSSGKYSHEESSLARSHMAVHKGNGARHNRDIDIRYEGTRGHPCLPSTAGNPDSRP